MPDCITTWASGKGTPFANLDEAVPGDGAEPFALGAAGLRQTVAPSEVISCFLGSGAFADGMAEMRSFAILEQPDLRKFKDSLRGQGSGSESTWATVTGHSARAI